MRDGRGEGREGETGEGLAFTLKLSAKCLGKTKAVKSALLSSSLTFRQCNVSTFLKIFIVFQKKFKRYMYYLAEKKKCSQLKLFQLLVFTES